MKIRLHGTGDECRELAGRLPAIADVLSVSEPYPDRGASRLVRVYIEARPVYAGTLVPGCGRPGSRPAGARRGLPPGGAR